MLKRNDQSADVKPIDKKSNDFLLILNVLLIVAKSRHVSLQVELPLEARVSQSVLEVLIIDR